MAEIVAAGIEAWTVFIETGLESRYYREARERVGERRAARITLLYFYLNTYSLEEQEQLEEDAELFLDRAAGFLRELYPLRDDPAEFRRASRRVFQRAMRGLFRRRGPGIDVDAHAFLRAMLTTLSSVDAIVDAYDDYREYMFRFYPQLHHAPA